MVVHMTVDRVPATGNFCPQSCVFRLLKSIALYEELEPQPIVFGNACQQSDVSPYVFIQVTVGDALSVTRPTEVSIVEILNSRAGHIHVIPERYRASPVTFRNRNARSDSPPASANYIGSSITKS